MHFRHYTAVCLHVLFRSDDIAELFGGFRVPVIAVGDVLKSNLFSLSCSYSAIPSCCGGVVLKAGDPTGTFIGMRIIALYDFSEI